MKTFQQIYQDYEAKLEAKRLEQERQDQERETARQRAMATISEYFVDWMQVQGVDMTGVEAVVSLGDFPDHYCAYIPLNDEVTLESLRQFFISGDGRVASTLRRRDAAQWGVAVKGRSDRWLFEQLDGAVHKAYEFIAESETMDKQTLIEKMFHANWNRTTGNGHISRVLTAVLTGTFADDVASEKENRYNEEFLALAREYLETYPDVIDIANEFLRLAKGERGYNPNNVLALIDAGLYSLIPDFDDVFRGTIVSVYQAREHVIIETTKGFYVSTDTVYTWDSFEAAMLYAICPQYHEAMMRLAGL